MRHQSTMTGKIYRNGCLTCVWDTHSPKWLTGTITNNVVSSDLWKSMFYVFLLSSYIDEDACNAWCASSPLLVMTAMEDVIDKCFIKVNCTLMHLEFSLHISIFTSSDPFWFSFSSISCSIGKNMPVYSALPDNWTSVPYQQSNHPSPLQPP